jgi:hypothetical protein
MKADSGSLVYIIISIALLIISSLGKKKKPVNPPTTDYEPDYEPQPQAPRPQQTSEWPKDLEDVFSKMFDVETPKPAEKPQPYEEEYKPETTYSSYESYTPENESLETIKDETESLEVVKPNEVDYAKSDYTFVSEKEYEIEEEESAFALETLEVEKAVVYAEIINRKYF